MTGDNITAKIDGLELKLALELRKEMIPILERMDSISTIKDEEVLNISKLYITGEEGNYKVEMKYETPRSYHTKECSLEEFYKL